MPRILVLATSRYTHGGISSVVKAHERSLAGYHKYKLLWIATHRNGSKTRKVIYMLRGMLSFLLHLPFCNIVHIHTSEPPSAMRKLVFMRLAKLAGKKTIVHFHAFDTASTIDGRHRDVYRKLFSLADRVIVLSNMWKKSVCATFDIADKVRVLHNPCPVVNPAPAEDSNADNTRKSILSAGVINDRKGYRDLIRAFAMIARHYPGWQLVFAGSGEIDTAKALAAELGIGDRVSFTGWVSGADKDRVFREATIFCLPSYAEGFPMAVLEAWAYGLPVITTPVGGLPEIVTDGLDAILFQPGDCNTLAVQIERLISNSELRKKIALASKNFAIDTFNIKTIARQLVCIYDELLEKR